MQQHAATHYKKLQYNMRWRWCMGTRQNTVTHCHTLQHNAKMKTMYWNAAHKQENALRDNISNDATTFDHVSRNISYITQFVSPRAHRTKTLIVSRQLPVELCGWCLLHCDKPAPPTPPVFVPSLPLSAEKWRNRTLSLALYEPNERMLRVNTWICTAYPTHSYIF